MPCPVPSLVLNAVFLTSCYRSEFDSSIYMKQNRRGGRKAYALCYNDLSAPSNCHRSDPLPMLPSTSGQQATPQAGSSSQRRNIQNQDVPTDRAQLEALIDAQESIDPTTNQRSWLCPYCGKTVQRKRFNFREHLQTHQPKDATAWTCGVCGEVLSGSRSGKRHLREVHGQNSPVPAKGDLGAQKGASQSPYAHKPAPLISQLAYTTYSRTSTAAGPQTSANPFSIPRALSNVPSLPLDYRLPHQAGQFDGVSSGQPHPRRQNSDERHSIWFICDREDDDNST